jgi:hypothetical protein
MSCQAMMLTRVPCPGGSGACTGGGELLESSWSASGALAWTGCGGGDGGVGGAVTLEILIGIILSCNVQLGLCAEADNE